MNHQLSVLVVLLMLIVGCKKKIEITEVAPPIEEDTIRTELRGVHIPFSSWMHASAESMKTNLSQIILQAAGNGFNAVFFDVRVLAQTIYPSPFEPGQKDLSGQAAPFDPLSIAISTARENGLRIHAVSTLDLSLTPQDLPVRKKRLKQVFRHLVENYDIDGVQLQVNLAEIPQNPAAPYKELIENVVVEMMLVKPYLQHSLTFSNGTSSDEKVMPFKELEKRGVLDFITPEFKERITLLLSKKNASAEQAVGLDVKHLVGAEIRGQQVQLMGRSYTTNTDADGRINILFEELPDTLDITTPIGNIQIPTSDWKTPYNFIVHRDRTVSRPSPWVEFRKIPEVITHDSEFHLLCKTDRTARAWIGTQSAKVYNTGIFFKKITLREGANRIQARAVDARGRSAIYVREFVYEPVDPWRSALPLWIEEGSMEPSRNMTLLSEDRVRISFKGALAQAGTIEINPGRISMNCSREDFEDYSIYSSDLWLDKLKTGRSYSINLNLTSAEGNTISRPMESNIGIQAPDQFPLVETIAESSILSYSLGNVRLGSPIRAEYPPGIRLKTNGRIGEYYRIQLSIVEHGYIHQRFVKELPIETPQPGYFITNLSCVPSSGADVLHIPYPEAVPYTVLPEPDLNRIVIKLYGVKTASTWITHHKGRKYIEKVTWKQTTPETYEIAVNLKTPHIWGYDLIREEKGLALHIKYPPRLNLKTSRPLAGLKIAIEAGHGGTSTGAEGLSGIKEKEINLHMARQLEALLKTKGAQVVQIRSSDSTISLAEKRQAVQQSGADIFISLHANAASTRGGYLRVGGTSTYYHNPFWAKFAEKVYDRLLELNINKFGVIGSFNYRVIRITEMPSILVEQAFMTHAEDEEKMTDPTFRRAMAEKINLGLMDYLQFLEEHDVKP